LRHPWVPGARIRLDARRHTTYWRRGLAAYEPHVARLLQEVVQTTWLVFEVGTHVGFFTVQLATRARLVVAFEPDGGNLSRTLQNLERNDLRNVMAVSAACGASPGLAPFVRDVRTGAAGGLAAHHHGEQAGPRTTVPVVRLEDAVSLAGTPDLVKIDAEGAEAAVLEGMGSLLDGPTRVLVEVGETTKGPVHDLLRRRGYRLLNPNAGMVEQPPGTHAGWHLYATKD
jgi:FkbM family methyltransferase